MQVDIRNLCRDDIEVMAREMRAIDRLEFDIMSGGRDLLACLDHLFDRSRRARAAYVDGRLVAVYGVLSRTALSDEGNPWLAGTDLLLRRDVRREFARQTRDQVIWACDGYSRLWNIVSSENTLAIRWLKWIGFVFDGTAYDIRGHRFLKFQIGE